MNTRISKELDLLVNNKEYAFALAKAKKEVVNNADDIELLINCGDIAEKLEDYNQADYYYGLAYGYDGSNVKAISGALICSIKKGKTQEANILYERIKFSDDEVAILARAEYYVFNNRLNSALDELIVGYEKYPSSLNVIIRLIELKQQNNCDDFEINQLIEEGLKLFPENADLLEIKIRQLYIDGKYSDCLKLCGQVAKKYPGTNLSRCAQSIRTKINTNISIRKNENEQLNSEKSASSVEMSSSDEIINKALAKLNALIGLSEVKNQIYAIKKKLEYENVRANVLGIPKSENEDNYHYIFMGNPGTGKTTVARLIGDIFFSYGILEKGQLIETSRGDLVSQFVGETALKTQKVIDKAMGGVLFIDEAYSLINGSEDNHGREALDTLVKNIEDHRTEFIVILAGYKKEMEMLLKQNSGLESRFRKIIIFPDFTDEELLEIAKLEAKKKNYMLTPDGERAFIEKINKAKLDSKFGNARAVRNLVEDAIEEKAKNYNPNRDGNDYFVTLQAKDFGVDFSENPEDKIHNSLMKLNQLIGLENVKSEVEAMISVAKYMNDSRGNVKADMRTLPLNLNLAFLGNPGTGKTTVARIYAELLAELGFLKKGHFIEATRSDFIGLYQGHTAQKTKELCESAYGGVLFIDEAYSLVNDARGFDNFGQEAVSTLLTEMENNRDKLVVIFAGYSREMSQFIRANSGLQSRIGKMIIFEDYTEDELFQIFMSMCKSNKISIDNQCQNAVKVKIHEIYLNKDDCFGNAREIRNLFDEVWKNMVLRVEHNNLKGDLRSQFTIDDINAWR